MHKINYIANSMEEFNYLEEAYKEFIKNYNLDFKEGELFIKQGSEKNNIEIILEEVYGKNNLIVTDKNSQNKIVTTIIPYQKHYNVFKIEDKEYLLGHRALNERIVQYDKPRWFFDCYNGITNGPQRF